jgi:hypothetical protein
MLIMPIINKCKNIDLYSLKFNSPERFKQKFISRCIYDGETPFFQITNINTLSGFFQLKDKYKINLILDNEEYYSFFMNLEAQCINSVANNYSKWFGENTKDNELESSFVSFLKLKGTNTILTLPIEFNMDGTCNIEIYNHLKERISCNSIQANNNLNLIIRFNGIQFAKNKFAPCWSISQIKVNKKQKVIEPIKKLPKLPKNSYQFIEDEGEELLEEESDDSADDIFNEHDFVMEDLKKQYRESSKYNEII